MKKYLIGFIFGLLFGSITSVLAARVIGSGYLIGWDVTVNGDHVCNDPYIHARTMEIECD